MTAAFVLDQNANRNGFCYQMGTTFLSGSNGGMLDIVDQNTRGDGFIYVDLACFRI